jgi:hypothetical protein
MCLYSVLIFEIKIYSTFFRDGKRFMKYRYTMPVTNDWFQLARLWANCANGSWSPLNDTRVGKEIVGFCYCLSLDCVYKWLTVKPIVPCIYVQTSASCPHLWCWIEMVKYTFEQRGFNVWYLCEEKNNHTDRVREGLSVHTLVFESQSHQRFQNWWRKWGQLDLS